jgi:hypothetical protein
VYDGLEKAREDLARAGGLPEPIVVGDIWSDIWKEETHHSTAMEGNSLARQQVEQLLEGGIVTGPRKELREYLEVQAYGDAARWVYTHARFSAYERPERIITETDIRQIHELVVKTVWAHFPPDPMLPNEGPGAYRKSELEELRPGLYPAPPPEIPSRLFNWVESANDPPADDCNFMEHLGRLHSAFERIHPFRDGNGRVGRLVLNLLLVRNGFPPAVIYSRQRDTYLQGLRKADEGELGPLGELFARAVTHSIHRFLLPALSGPHSVVPLAALADEQISKTALLSAAQRGRLQAYNVDGWYSTRHWVNEYLADRRQGRKAA